MEEADNSVPSPAQPIETSQIPAITATNIPSSKHEVKSETDESNRRKSKRETKQPDRFPKAETKRE